MSDKNNQPTYKRQRFLLAFIRQLQNNVSLTDLQKLIFLHEMNKESFNYEFIPYKYGSYSFKLADDIEILQRDGFIASAVTARGNRIRAIGNYKQGSPYTIATERGNDLIRKAYREYPYYAINSEILDKIFRGEELRQFKDRKQQYKKAEQVLFTIGYEGKSIEAFINALIKNDIRLLCDVRKNPLSRKFGFSKGKLSHILDTIGLKYVHIPDLGIESDKRNSLETIKDYKVLFLDYANTLPTRMLFLEFVNSLLFSNKRITLMCYEKKAEMCHRHIIRDYLVDNHNIVSVDL